MFFLAGNISDIDIHIFIFVFIYYNNLFLININYINTGSRHIICMKSPEENYLLTKNIKMKTLTKLFAFICILCIAQFSIGQITGTAHDFSSAGWNASGEICIVCHTPHNAISATDAPLWNHTLTTASFTLYSSSTLDATLGQPDGNSLLCLSCHDGTVALDSYGGATGSTTIGAGGLVGTDLSDDHPVSFTYDATLYGLDPGLNDPDNTNSGLGSTITDDLLFSGKMQCGSCHDVHDDTNGNFLIISNDASALCLTCHNK